MKFFAFSWICIVFIIQHPIFAITSSFNSGLDGWTSEGSGQLSFATTGGNPGGFAKYTDTVGSGGDGWLIAPSTFLGDWTTMNGSGVLSWDHKILVTGDVSQIVSPGAVITGPGGSATYTSTLPFHNSWTTFSAPINSEVSNSVQHR